MIILKNKRMRIEKKTFKIITILIIVIILLLCCIIAIQNPEKYTFVLLPSKYLVIILSTLGIIAILYLCNFLIRLIFNKNAFFEINEIGIYNGLGFTKKKQIDWKFIKEIDTVNYQGILRIRVKVYDNKPFIENTDFITQFILKRTIKELGTPVLLDNVYLKCSFDDLNKLIFDSWDKYKKQ
jgi:hypothetical protein